MQQDRRIGFSIDGLVATGFKRAVGVATNSLGDLNSKIKGIEGKQKNIDKFSGLRQDLRKTSNEFRESEAKCKRLEDEINSTAKPTAKLKNEFAAAQRKSLSLKKSMGSQITKLKGLGNSLRDAGVDTRNLSRDSKKLAKDLDKASKSREKLQKKELRNKSNKNVREGIKSKAVAVGGSAVALGVMGASNARMETAQGEIKSLGWEEEDIKKITAAGLEFSEKWSGTTAPEFVKASYDIKSGISSLGAVAVGKFTQIAALTGKATKSSTGEMTTLLAKGFGIYRDEFSTFGRSTIKGWQAMSAEEKNIKFGESFSAGIAKTVQAFRTDGSQMSQALSTLGSGATKAGYSMQNQLAILGQLQTTMSGSESATKFNAFLNGAGKASEALGLEFNNASGQLKSMPDILDEIRDKYGDTLETAEKDELTKAFGSSEATKVITDLIDKTKELRDGAKSIGVSMGTGLDPVRKMADAMNNGTSERWGIAAQAVENLSASIGAGLAPIIIGLADTIAWAASTTRLFISEFPLISSVIIPVVGGLVGLSAVILGVGFAMTYAGRISVAYTNSIKFLRWAKNKLSITTMLGTAREKASAVVHGASKAIKGGYIWTVNALNAAKKRLAVTTLISSARERISAIATGASLAIKGGYVAVVNMVSAAKARLGLITALGTARTWLSVAAFGAVSVAQGAYAAVTGVATAAQWAFNAAQAANPMVWIVGAILVGVVALIGAGVLLYKKFKPFRDLIDAVWSKIKSVVKYGAKLLGINFDADEKKRDIERGSCIDCGGQVDDQRSLVMPKPKLRASSVPTLRGMPQRLDLKPVDKRAVQAGSATNSITNHIPININADSNTNAEEVKKAAYDGVMDAQEKFKRTQAEILHDQERVSMES